MIKPLRRLMVNEKVLSPIAWLLLGLTLLLCFVPGDESSPVAKDHSGCAICNHRVAQPFSPKVASEVERETQERIERLKTEGKFPTHPSKR